jgi:hypothetical protein
MFPYIKNQQHKLAQQFRQTESYVLQESRVAYLKIQSWQFALRTPEVGILYQKESEEMIRRSLLCFVPNNFVLCEVGYYIEPIEN